MRFFLFLPLPNHGKFQTCSVQAGVVALFPKIGHGFVGISVLFGQDCGSSVHLAVGHWISDSWTCSTWLKEAW